ncbi:ACP S-malonyltransferase [Lentzea sp. NPDC060358]|uniref:ACP S-malonyltransferase n=1 Tax=Lentzea sp. NPDC060358 TaxID=3347103 RepID=UPI003668B8F9
MIALLAPGQGSQTPGMLTPWLELEGAEKQVRTWSEITGLDLVRLGTTAEADEIVDTAITQPLVVALAVLAFGELRRRVELPADVVVAGHSVGELAAAAIAGVISADDAVALAGVRGAAMARACALEPTGMAAVLGGDEQEVLARLEELGLVPANRNGAGQIVAAGPRAALDELAETPPGTAKVRKLAVAGAFHTRYMAPAEDAVRARAAEVATQDPSLPLLSNKDGQAVTDGAEVLSRLVSQVTSPVRWDACQATLVGKGITASVELPPAGALTGLAKRAMKGTATLALKTPDQLEKVAELFDTVGADK